MYGEVASLNLTDGFFAVLRDPSPPRGKVYILVSYGPLGTMWGSGFLSHGRELNVGFLAVVGACW